MLDLDAAANLAQAELLGEQSKDPELAALISYVEDGTVPEDPVLAKRLTIEGTQYA